MDNLNQLALEVFNNKEHYTTNDYLVIMNVLKEQYHRINGDLPMSNQEDKKVVCECNGCTNEVYEEELCFDCYEYKYYNDYSDSYLNDYIEPY